MEFHSPSGLIYRGRFYDVGRPIPVTEEDRDRLLSAGLIERLQAADQGAPPADDPEDGEYEDLNKPGLQELLTERGIEFAGGDTKAQLIERLQAADQGAE